MGSHIPLLSPEQYSHMYYQSNYLSLLVHELLLPHELPLLVLVSQYSVPQVNITDTFWSPMGTLGNDLWKKDQNRDQLKAEFEKTIANIKDE